MAKICHMSSAHQNNDTRIFYKQCTSLAKAGYQTYFVVRGDSFEKNGVNIIGVQTQKTSRLQRMFKTSKEIYKAAAAINADIYELHDPELLPYALKLKKQGKKVIFDSHEDYPTQILEKEWIPILLRKIISACYKNYETYAVRKFDAVLFPCTKNGVNIFENRAQKTVIISNAVLVSETNLPENQAVKDYKTICCTGSLTEQRGITKLIMAAHIAGVRLILAGKYSSPEYQAQLEKMSEYSCVDYRGYLGRDELAEVYNKSSIGMSTILNVGQYNSLDNFPTKVYEYMAVGLPVIVSDYPFLKNAVENAGFGLAVNPDNPEEIARAIKKILSNPEEAIQMGKRGRQAVLEKYNWSIEEKKLLELYEELAKK